MDSTNSISFEIANRPLNDSIAFGYTATLEIESDFHTENINWESQNGAVATISSNGVITAVQNGSTVITATVTVDNNNYTDSFVLTVKDSIFEDNDKFDDEDVKSKALDKMNWYYYNKEEIREVVDGNSDCDTCIFAFEGLGEGFGGITEENQISAPYSYHKLPYNFLNAMMVVTKGNKIEYVTRRASTLPDWRPEPESIDRTTTLASGIYDYRTGDHKGQYIALVPNWDVSDKSYWDSWYIENNKFKPGGADGINLHATGTMPGSTVHSAHSWGCQTVYYKDYVEFGKAVGFLTSNVENVTEETSKGRGVSVLVPEKTGTTSSDNDIYVSVKYILNRSFDQKNFSQNFTDGIFYPKN